MEEFSDDGAKIFWPLTERLAKVFQENNARPYFYWANLFWKDKVAEIQNIISLPINFDVFMSVRQSLYAESENFSTDIDTTLQTPYLWINGFHDLIMNGASAYVKKSSPVRLFFKSAHYPHIEEHKKFCETVNAFLKNMFFLFRQKNYCD